MCAKSITTLLWWQNKWHLCCLWIGIVIYFVALLWLPQEIDLHLNRKKAHERLTVLFTPESIEATNSISFEFDAFLCKFNGQLSFKHFAIVLVILLKRIMNNVKNDVSYHIELLPSLMLYWDFKIYIDTKWVTIRNKKYKFWQRKCVNWRLCAIFVYTRTHTSIDQHV